LEPCPASKREKPEVLVDAAICVATEEKATLIVRWAGWWR
jgi:hypothetical protein